MPSAYPQQRTLSLDRYVRLERCRLTTEATGSAESFFGRLGVPLSSEGAWHRLYRPSHPVPQADHHQLSR